MASAGRILPPDVLRLVVKISAGHHPASRDAPDLELDPASRRGAVPVVPVVASVCRAWRDAMRVDPAELWRVADFSGDFDPPIAALARLRAAGAFARLVHLDLTDCPNASSDASLAAILAAAPEVRHVAVSDVGATRRSAKPPPSSPPRIVSPPSESTDSSPNQTRRWPPRFRSWSTTSPRAWR